MSRQLPKFQNIFYLVLPLVYTLIFRIVVDQATYLAGLPLSPYERVITVSAGVLLACIIVFAPLLYLVTCNLVIMGMFCSLCSFLYLYIYHPDQGIILTFVQVILDLPSLANMIQVILIPILLAFGLRNLVPPKGD